VAELVFGSPSEDGGQSKPFQPLKTIRKRRHGVLTALAGDNGPALARGHTPVQNGNQA